jgi:hypothetical protein
VRHQRLPRENGSVAKAATELIVAAERAQDGYRAAPCAGETSGIAAHTCGDQEERRLGRRLWSQVVAVASGLPANVVAI